MKKKILLLILLLLPFIVLAKENYRLETSKQIEGIVAEIIDNGDCYILQSEESLIRLDKKTGDIKTLPFKGEKAWANYNQKENKLEPTETTHYVVYESGNLENDYEENGYLIDKDFKIISKIDASDISIDLFFKNDRIILYDASSRDHLRIEVYDKEINLLKESRVETECYYDYYEDINKFVSKNSSCTSTVFEVDDNYDLVKNTKDKLVFFDDGYIVKIDLKTSEEIKAVPISEAYIDDIRYYNGFYYVYYEKNNEIYLAKYDENLNKITSKNISRYEGLEHSTSWLMYFDGTMFFEAIVRDKYDNDVRIFYEIDSELNLIPSTSSKLFKSNVMTYTDYSRIYPDTKSFSKSFDIHESLNDYYRGQILDIKKVKDKYYYLTYTIDDENDNYKVESYVYIYDENNKLLKKTKIYENTFNTLNTNIQVGCLNYIDNKIIATFTNSETSLLKTMDLNGNILDVDIEVTDNNYLPFYSIINGNTTITTAINNTILTNPESKIYSKVTYFKSLNETNIISDHGEVKIPDDVYYGDEVELDIKPEEGFEIKDIIIKDENGNIIPVTDNKFIMPNGDITIDVEYELKSTIKEIIDNPYTLDAIIVVISVTIISFVAFIYNKKKTAYLK